MRSRAAGIAKERTPTCSGTSVRPATRLLFALLEIAVVAALVESESPVPVELDDAIRSTSEKGPIVGHDEYGAGEAFQRRFEKLDRG